MPEEIFRLYMQFMVEVGALDLVTLEVTHLQHGLTFFPVQILHGPKCFEHVVDRRLHFVAPWGLCGLVGWDLLVAPDQMLCNC